MNDSGNELLSRTRDIHGAQIDLNEDVRHEINDDDDEVPPTIEGINGPQTIENHNVGCGSDND